MTLWSVGQGIGVRVRCWIEEAIKDLIIYQKEHFGWEIESVYSLSDLKRGNADTDVVALAGEEQTNTATEGTGWFPFDSRSSRLQRGSHRRLIIAMSSEEALGNGMPNEYKTGVGRSCLIRPPVHSRIFQFESTAFQEAWLCEVAHRPEQEASIRQKLVCNLLVLEKPPRKVRAFRFASPRLSSLRALREEKKNLLLLYGWLRQEKPFRIYQDSVQ